MRRSTDSSGALQHLRGKARAANGCTERHTSLQQSLADSVGNVGVLVIELHDSWSRDIAVADTVPDLLEEAGRQGGLLGRTESGLLVDGRGAGVLRAAGLGRRTTGLRSLSGDNSVGARVERLLDLRSDALLGRLDVLRRA